MTNKKIILSLLIVGLLACVATTATWAYFQDTLDINNTRITTANLSSQYSLIAIPTDESWIVFYGDTGNKIASTNITNLVPGDAKTSQYIHIRNMGNTTTKITATITPTSQDIVEGLIIKVGGQSIYTNGFNSATSFPIVFDSIAPEAVTDTSIAYEFTNTEENQNSMENKSVAFNMNIAVRAVSVQ